MRTDKLELKHLAPFQPHNLLVNFNNETIGVLEGVGLDHMFFDLTAMEHHGGATFKSMKWCLDDTKPYLRSISMLPKYMPSILKAVSLLDLNDDWVTFVIRHEFETKKDGGLYIDAIDKKTEKVVDSIGYYCSAFFAMNNDGTYHPINPQHEAINQLYKYHFDLDNLLLQDLAYDLDALVLEGDDVVFKSFKDKI